MSKIAIISDSHGSLRNLSLFRARIGQPDALWHLGDCADDAPELARALNCGFVSVRGNCDPFSDAPLKQVIEWHGRRFLLLHGHTVSGRLNLLYLAKELRCDAVLYGHSHVTSDECVDNIRLINPGSLSRPRSSAGPSMALLLLDDGVFDFRLLFSE